MIWHPELSIILTENIPDDCTIHGLVWIGKNVKVGHRVRIEALSFIPEGVIIGDDVFIAANVIFTNDRRPPSDRQCWEQTIVKKGASIGAGSRIRCGVTIGEYAMIGMGSIITKDVPAGELWYGEAAEKKGMREWRTHSSATHSAHETLKT